MDELELLKRDWNATGNDFQTYDDTDLYKMSHKKSSSIVKTLFYISVGELLFWLLLNIIPMFFSDFFREQIIKISHNNVYVIISIVYYLIIILFAYLLYKSHKSISVTDSAKQLMENILKTRKIIKYYVIYNLFIALLSVPLALYVSINEDPELASKIAAMDNSKTAILIGFVILITVVMLSLVWLFYRLIYGILIKRLNKNYAELKRIED